MDKLKILITGGSGYIAKSIHSYLYSKYDITLASRADLDLTQREETQHYFKDKYFDIVIHTAVKGGSRLNSFEGPDIALSNLLMYDNLMRCRDKFNKLIHFGSGAEEEANTPYGFSKHIINQLIKLDPKSINIKIYAVFDENELSTRFIKSNIQRYINHQPMQLSSNKQMDFFYMPDLVSLVDYFITKEEWDIKRVDCTYSKSYTLVEIANMINNLDNYKVKIIVDNLIEKPYIGTYRDLQFRLVGLEQGIKNVYNIIKQNQ